jgi:hypothetical protein
LRNSKEKPKNTSRIIFGIQPKLNPCSVSGSACIKAVLFCSISEWALPTLLLVLLTVSDIGRTKHLALPVSWT